MKKKSFTSIASRHMRAGLFSATCFAFCITAGYAAPPVVIADTYGSVEIGDLNGMIDSVAGLAGKVSPGVSADVLRAQAGMMLGDPGLKSLGAGSGVVLVFPKSGEPFVLLETADGKAESLAELLKGRGAQAEKISDALIAIGPRASALETAKGPIGTAAAEQLAKSDDAFIFARLDADGILKDKEAELDKGLEQLARQVTSSGETTDTAKLAKFAGELFRSAVKRSDVITVKVDISDKGIQFEKELFAIGGIKVGAPSGPTGQELLKQVPVPENAVAYYENYVNTKDVATGLVNLVNEAATAADLDPKLRDEIVKTLNNYGDAYGDGGAMAYSLDFEKGIKSNYLLTVKDKAKAEETVAQMKDLYGPDKPFTQLLEKAGFKITTEFSSDAKTAEGDVIHRMKMNQEPVKNSDDFPEAFRNTTSDIVVLDDKMVIAIASESTDIEAAVKAAKAGESVNSVELQSRKDLPPGAVMYMDYDMGAVMKNMPKVADPGAKAMMESFQGLDNATLLQSAYLNNESFKYVFRIPESTITGIANKAMEAAMKARTQE